MDLPKAKFEKFDDLLADPDYVSVADFWKKLLAEYENPPLPTVSPCEDGGYSLSWDDGTNYLEVTLGTVDDDGWFWRDRITKKYDGSNDHEPNIDVVNFAKLLREIPWQFNK